VLQQNNAYYTYPHSTEKSILPNSTFKWCVETSLKIVVDATIFPDEKLFPHLDLFFLAFVLTRAVKHKKILLPTEKLLNKQKPLRKHLGGRLDHAPRKSPFPSSRQVNTEVPERTKLGPQVKKQELPSLLASLQITSPLTKSA